MGDCEWPRTFQPLSSPRTEPHAVPCHRRPRPRPGPAPSAALVARPLPQAPPRLPRGDSGPPESSCRRRRRNARPRGPAVQINLTTAPWRVKQRRRGGRSSGSGLRVSQFVPLASPLRRRPAAVSGRRAARVRAFGSCFGPPSAPVSGSTGSTSSATTADLVDPISTGHGPRAG